jgi:hypothetical protein
MAAVSGPASRLTWQFFSKIGSQELVQIRDRVDVVLGDRARELTLFASAARLAPAEPIHLVPAPVVPAPARGPELRQFCPPGREVLADFPAVRRARGIRVSGHWLRTGRSELLAAAMISEPASLLAPCRSRREKPPHPRRALLRAGRQ